MATWIAPKAAILRVSPPVGDEGLRIKGSFTVGELTPAIHPDIYGVHIRVIDRNGKLIVDETIPGGSPNKFIRWKATGNPQTQWMYTDKSKHTGHNGISRVFIRRKLSAPNTFSVQVTGNKGLYPLLIGDDPIRVTFELNSNALPPGGTPGRDQCGEVQFGKLVKPRCKFVGANLNCM